MEIKTSKDIVNEVGSFKVLVWDKEKAKKKWVAIDDLIKELENLVPRGVSPYYDRVKKLTDKLKDVKE
ncbi:hypothetical protein LCGC14_1399480 [marine sediment metagenome]|uniref:Uncharacterized protein n=1 Tax=marine sediment metagenome TaxID=412755 RepID=A0A0F9JXS3_9ZZZZ